MTWFRRGQPKAERISVIFFENKETHWWSAQCVEYDIAAQAKSFSEVHAELERVIDGHIFVSRKLGLEPFKQLRPAPEVYRRVFDRSEKRIEEVSKRPVQEIRIADFSLACH